MLWEENQDRTQFPGSWESSGLKGKEVVSSRYYIKISGRKISGNEISFSMVCLAFHAVQEMETQVLEENPR